MKRQSPRSIVALSAQAKSSAFTLVEMLVSMGVLVLLVVMVAQLTNAATATVTSNRGRMDADSQARMIFDRMGRDIAKMVKRKDVDYHFVNQQGNDAMFFFSEAPAFFDTSPKLTDKSTVALVGYRINSSNQLERLGKGLTWDGQTSSPTPGGMVFLTYAANSTTPVEASTIAGNWSSTIEAESKDADYHVIGDQVFRMEISYVDKSSGKLSITAASDNGLQDISAIVVTIAMADTTSRKTITNFSKLTSALIDPTAPDQDVAQIWLNTVKQSNFAKLSGIPKLAASQIRIYERYFYLNNN